MQHPLPLLFRLPDIRNTGKPQRAALDVVQRKAVQALELHAINEDFNLSIHGNNVHVLHGASSLRYQGSSFSRLAKMARYAHSADRIFTLPLPQANINTNSCVLAENMRVLDVYFGTHEKYCTKEARKVEN